MSDIIERTISGEYSIIDPVAVALDGGTISFRVQNADGDIQALFIDRRLNTDTPDEFYAKDYPGSDNSVRLGKNDQLLSIAESYVRGRT